MAHDMTIEEIIHQLSGHENRRAYYSGYDDKYARADLREAEKGIKHCTALLNQRIAAMNEAMAILREIAAKDGEVFAFASVDECMFCGAEVVMVGDDAVGAEGSSITHKPDCPVARAVRLVGGG